MDIIYEAPAYNALTETVNVSADGNIYTVDLEKALAANYNICDPDRNITVTYSDRATPMQAFFRYCYLKNENPLSGIVTKQILMEASS